VPIKLPKVCRAHENAELDSDQLKLNA